jgi:rhodanese-related sulfurtransferase
MVLLIILTAVISACRSDHKTEINQGSYKTIDKATFKEMMDQSNTVILDVRTDIEYNNGHIPNAVHINFYASDFNERVAGLDTSKTYLVYCHSGSRSRKACKFMTTALKFPYVYEFSGGWRAWSAKE